MKNITFYFIVLVSSNLFAQEQTSDSCNWTRDNEKVVLETIQDSKKLLPQELNGCDALHKYYQALVNKVHIKQNDTSGILLSGAQEYSSALRVLWILDQYRDEYVNVSKTAKYVQVLELFEKSMNAYFEKLNAMNDKHMAALTSKNAEDILDWQFMGQIYQDQVDLVQSDWVTYGYKNETYQLAAKAESQK